MTFSGAFTNVVRQAKAQLKFNLVSNVKGNKISFFKYISGNRKIRVNVFQLLNGVGVLLTEEIKKTKILKAFFTSTSKISLQKFKDAEAKEKIWSKEDILLQENQVREYLSNLVIHKSMGPHGIHS